MTEIRQMIAAERRELAAVLGGLPAERWDEPTLCAGWRVREVVAHMTMPFRYKMPKIIVELVKARGDFNRMADRRARADAAAVSAGDLVRSIRDNADHPWRPPGSGFDAPLSHDVIHGLDITVPLGIDRRVPGERLRTVLAGINPKGLRYFGVDLTGVRLCADDLDWEYGTGAPLAGRAQDLLLVLSGRELPPGHLRGESSARFTAP